MNNLHPDLFPETLLVTIRDGHTETDSLKVCERFDRAHRNVTRDIENLIAEVEKLGEDALNFERISYRDSMNRERKMYRMDRLAFSVLANRFTGVKALAWQLEYHRQFELMERQLTTRYVAALDQVRPYLRPVTEATEAGLSCAATGAPLGKSAASISYHRGVARRLGLLSAVRVTRMAAAAPQDMQQQGV